MSPKPRRAFAGKEQFALHVSFGLSDFPWIQPVIVPTKSDPHTPGNRQDFASVADQPWKTRSDQCRDNLRSTNRRDCELMKNWGAHSLKFHNVRSRRPPGSTSP